jgi:hypothetical protein
VGRVEQVLAKKASLESGRGHRASFFSIDALAGASIYGSERFLEIHVIFLSENPFIGILIDFLQKNV